MSAASTPSAGSAATAGSAANGQGLAGLNGVEVLEAFVRGAVPPPPMVALLGLSLDEVTRGVVTFSGVPKDEHYNALGTVHGGFMATLCDSALGCAVHSALDEKSTYTTTDLTVTFVRPVTSATGRLQCRAEVLHIGRRLATAEARVTDDQGKLYAHATTSCMIFPRPDSR